MSVLAADLNKIVADLDWLRAVLITGITGGGGYGIFRLWKLFSSDFLTPYRDEIGDARETADAAKAEAAAARAEAAAMRIELFKCQEREQILRLDLIRAGVKIPPPEEPIP